MMEFIRFLDCHEGSLMVLITAVYVLATILICWANMKFAKAAQEQLTEAKRQYVEENRPRITYEVILRIVRGMVCDLPITDGVWLLMFKSNLIRIS